MKKIMIFAVACAALVACSKEAETAVDANHFEKGQEVTLTVKAGESSTRVSSQLDTKDGSIAFKWEATDKIKVTVGGKDAEFSVSKLNDGGTSAEFKGTMPGSGSTFNVQYPYDAPSLQIQEYTTTDKDILPHDMMLFTATGCTLEKPFTLTANNAALRLNLWGTGQIISKIKVTNITTEKTYTLAMDSAVTLPATEATAQAFFIIVDADDAPCTFSAEVFDNSSTPASICTFTMTNAQSFYQNTILNMAAKEVKKSSTEPTFTVDANGNKVYFSPGNLYYDGSKFVFEEKQYEYHSNKPEKSSVVDNGLFCWAPNTNNLTSDIEKAMKDGFGISYEGINDSPVFFTNATETTARTDFTVNEESGKWRTLSKSEWEYLVYKRPIAYRYAEVQVTKDDNSTVVKGLLIFPDSFTWPLADNRQPETFNNPCTNWGNVTYSNEEFKSLENAGCVFLPAAGGRNNSKGGEVKPVSKAGEQGTYWTSTNVGGKDGSTAYRWTFNAESVDEQCISEEGNRNSGRSVRLVRKAN